MAQKYAEYIPSPLERLKKHIHSASGVLILDSTFASVRGRERYIHIAYDTALGVVDFWIDVAENKTAYAYLLRRLKEAGYPFRCVVSDGHFAIVPAVDEEGYPHQRCIFHLLRNLKVFLSEQGEFSNGNGILYSRIKYILKSPTIEALEKRVSWFRKYSASHFQTKRQKSALGWLWHILPQATIHLCFVERDIPRTSNLLENLNGQIKARLKTFRGVKSEKSLNNLLKILFHFRSHK